MECTYEFQYNTGLVTLIPQINVYHRRKLHPGPSRNNRALGFSEWVYPGARGAKRLTISNISPTSPKVIEISAVQPRTVPAKGIIELI